jgi:hypothetical protein
MKWVSTPIGISTVTGLLLLFGSLSHALDMESVHLGTAYRFDGLVTHGWEHDMGGKARLSPMLQLSGAATWIDATQEPIAGIVRLRGQIVSGIIGLQWTTLSNHLTIDANAGIDGVIEEKVKPRGVLKLVAAVPLPINPFIQHLKFTPEAWYTHSMFNGPAIRNTIASYGFAGDLGWSMGPKMAAAVNYRQEYLRPAQGALDSNFTASSALGYPVDTDTLHPNIKQTFYLYAYRQFLKVLYVGYSFSMNNTDEDRRVITGADIHVPQNPYEPLYYLFNWAYYPYPTPRRMLTHSITAAGVFTMGTVAQLKVKGAFPVYSRQEIKAVMPYYEPSWGMNNAWDRNEYGVYSEKNTGILSFGAETAVRVTSRLSCTVNYDYFGFPYRAWAYFTKDSYSLHTVSFVLQQRF